MNVPIPNTPLSLISEIRYATGERRWLNGDCFKLYRILKAAFPEAEAYYQDGHVYTAIKGIFYDIRGSHLPEMMSGEYFSEVEERIQRDAWEWAYSEEESAKGVTA